MNKIKKGKKKKIHAFRHAFSFKKFTKFHGSVYSFFSKNDIQSKVLCMHSSKGKK